MCSMNDLNANFTTLKMIGGGKLLKKLWCCVGGEYNKIIWFYQLG